jgi:hypothetical protein
MKGMKSMKPIKTRRNEHMTIKEQQERLHDPIATAGDGNICPDWNNLQKR